MKSIAKNNKSIRIKVAGTVAILIIIVGAIGLYTLILRPSDKIIPTSEAATTVKDSDAKAAQPSENLPDNSQSLTTEEVPIKPSASATITRLEQKDTTVYFDASITGAATLGKCVVSFTTPNDKPVTKEFDAIKNGDKYTCSLSTSALEFSYLGKWDATLRYYDDNSQIITKGSIEIS